MESLSYIVSLSWLGLDPSEMGIALFALLPLTLPILMVYFMGKEDKDETPKGNEKD
jgi:hypothetical protein